jgi:acyl-coenzyme A synthetase/AMP-(fatty) acid ligase
MRLMPCTADHLRTQAMRSPGALALHERGVDLRYGELDLLTGDIGRLLAPRVLRLLGRHDDLVVLGGLKVPAAVLEDDLRRHPCVADCAVVALRSPAAAAAAGR